jgi:DNA-binding NarL/FixJ family response regulator
MSDRESAVAGAPLPRPPTVLLVEGSAVLRERLARLLAEVPGLAVAEAGSAAEAVAWLTRQGADAVVVDVDLAGAADPGALQLVRRAAPRALLIAIGAEDSRELVEFCRGAGADHFFRTHTESRQIGEVLRALLVRLGS